MAGDEAVAGGGRYGTDAAGYAAMLAAVKAWPERIWAVEGCQGIGRHLAGRLLATPATTSEPRSPTTELADQSADKPPQTMNRAADWNSSTA